jgi:hypothetical protein
MDDRQRTWAHALYDIRNYYTAHITTKTLKTSTVDDISIELAIMVRFMHPIDSDVADRISKMRDELKDTKDVVKDEDNTSSDNVEEKEPIEIHRLEETSIVNNNIIITHICKLNVKLHSCIVIPCFWCKDNKIPLKVGYYSCFRILMLVNNHMYVKLCNKCSII